MYKIKEDTLLVDGVFINVGGGKILLDYLIEELERCGKQVSYLLDERVKGQHPVIGECNEVQYIKGGLTGRYFFYKRNAHRFANILCFGNIPPFVRVPGKVYTYFHQLLYLRKNKEVFVLQRWLLEFKKTVLRWTVTHTDFWLVQSQEVKDVFLQQFPIVSPDAVKVLPFYPALRPDIVPDRSGERFLYVSAGYMHKNHKRLLKAFVKLYDKTHRGELHLTIGEESAELLAEVERLEGAGYPVVNHSAVSRKQLAVLYASAGYVVYPSLAESFGLGVIEAIENGCKLIASDLPWTYAVCQPSLTFDPSSVGSIEDAMHKALTGSVPLPKSLVFNQINELLKLLR